MRNGERRGVGRSRCPTVPRGASGQDLLHDAGLVDRRQLLLQAVLLDEELRRGAGPAGAGSWRASRARSRGSRRRPGRARRSRRRSCPPLMPPPAIQVQKAFLLWSRPALRSSLSAGSWAMGSRPNSPPQTTSVLSSSPRCFRSRSRAAIGWSVRSQAAFSVGGQSDVWLSQIWRVDVELHEPHAALDQPAGDQAAPAVRVGRLAADAVHLQRRRALVREVERIGRRELHAGGQLVAGDAGVEVRLAGPPALVDAGRAGPAGRARAATTSAGRSTSGCRFSTGEPVERNRVPWKCGGRKPDCQFSTPLIGRPSGSSSTT